MATKPTDMAYPVNDSPVRDWTNIKGGMSKREYLAIHAPAMPAALLTNVKPAQDPYIDAMTGWALAYADSLIAKLNK